MDKSNGVPSAYIKKAPVGLDPRSKKLHTPDITCMYQEEYTIVFINAYPREEQSPVLSSSSTQIVEQQRSLELLVQGDLN